MHTLASQSIIICGFIATTLRVVEFILQQYICIVCILCICTNTSQYACYGQLLYSSRSMGYSLSTYYAQLEYIMFLHQLEQYAYSTAVLVIIYELVILRTLQFLLVGSMYVLRARTPTTVYCTSRSMHTQSASGITPLSPDAPTRLFRLVVIANQYGYKSCMYLRSMHNSQLFSMHTSSQRVYVLDSMLREYYLEYITSVHTAHINLM